MPVGVLHWLGQCRGLGGFQRGCAIQQAGSTGGCGLCQGGWWSPDPLPATQEMLLLAPNWGRWQSPAWRVPWQSRVSLLVQCGREQGTPRS